MASNTLSSEHKNTTVNTNLKNGLIGGVLAAAISLVLFFIGNALVGPIEVALQPGAPVAPLPWFMIIGATLVPALVGALVLTGLQRFTGNGTRIFQIVAGVIALVSLFPAITQVGSTGAAVILALLHLVAAGSIVWALTMRRG